MTKDMNKYLQIRVAVAVIMLFISSQVLSLTVYDVIQLSTKQYSDKDIITLIEVTNSAFELKAEDIPRLLDLGVSETIIQTMLKAVPKQTEHSQSSSAPGVSAGIITSSANHAGPEHKPPLIAGGYFDNKPFQESASGHHHHQAITLAGVNLLVLRHKGEFNSIKSRANAAVTQLQFAVASGKGMFKSNTIKGNHAVLFYRQNTSQPIYILSISTADANAYQRRSGREVSPTLLAAYWSSILSDYWSIAVNDVQPARLADVHEGEALSDLYQQWITPPVISTTRLQDVVRLLSSQTQQHLQHLATMVPRDFVVNKDFSLVDSQ